MPVIAPMARLPGWAYRVSTRVLRTLSSSELLLNATHIMTRKPFILNLLIGTTAVTTTYHLMVNGVDVISPNFALPNAMVVALKTSRIAQAICVSSVHIRLGAFWYTGIGIGASQA